MGGCAGASQQIMPGGRPRASRYGAEEILGSPGETVLGGEGASATGTSTHLEGSCRQQHTTVGLRFLRRYNTYVLERLQKILSARGIASRRKAEEYILQGLVLVNGKPATLGQKADPDTDKIEVKGEVMEARKDMLYYVMNKPRGIVTSNIETTPGKEHAGGSAGGSPTVRELLPRDLQGKIYPVGRLDKDSTGLLLLTNDGVLAFRLTHPKFEHDKEYEVETEHEIMTGQLQKLAEGMIILGEKTKPADVKRTGKRSFRIILTEGRNRQIRRMCQKVGCPVKTLKRVRIMTLEDPGLREGKIRTLSSAEKAQLLASVGL